MGKVTISEPVKGESLTVTKINSTIASWTTEASNINGENVHDQSLDNYNFAENSVRSQNERIRKGVPLFRQTTSRTRKERIYKADSSLDIQNHEHIFRVSLDIYVNPAFNREIFSTHDFIEITISLVFRSNQDGASRFTIFSNISPRKFRIKGQQLLREHIHYNTSISTHLNKHYGLASNITNFEASVKLEYESSGDHFITEKDFVLGIYGYFADLETIKR